VKRWYGEPVEGPFSILRFGTQHYRLLFHRSTELGREPLATTILKNALQPPAEFITDSAGSLLRRIL